MPAASSAVKPALTRSSVSTPSNAAACAQLNADLGDAAALYHCGDDAYLSSIYLWRTPLAACGDGREDCTDYTVWTQKWQEIRG
mgnify:CR=1 FL=1